MKRDDIQSTATVTQPDYFAVARGVGDVEAGEDAEDGLGKDKRDEQRGG